MRLKSRNKPTQGKWYSSRRRWDSGHAGRVWYSSRRRWDSGHAGPRSLTVYMCAAPAGPVSRYEFTKKHVWCRWDRFQDMTVYQNIHARRLAPRRPAPPRQRRLPARASTRRCTRPKCKSKNGDFTAAQERNSENQCGQSHVYTFRFTLLTRVHTVETPHGVCHLHGTAYHDSE